MSTKSGPDQIFVHAAKKGNTRESIALQYTPEGIDSSIDAPMSPPPKIKWTSPFSLAIVANGAIGELVKQRRRVDGVTVKYKLAGPIWSTDSDYEDDISR